MNPRVRHPPLPIEQMDVLLLQAGERLALQRVTLSVAYLPFNLAPVTRRTRLGGQDDRGVVFGEGLDLRIQIRVETSLHQSALMTAALRLSTTSVLGIPPK